jgi:hypothetical protein
MDYIRDPYDIPARFFADDDQEHTLRWRPASEGADVFPEPHKFGSLFNGYFNWVDGSHIGEVFKGSEPRRGLRAINRWFNNRPALGYDVGLTPCEPLESFRTGETFDEERPPALYNEDGFPRCCLDRTVPRFGVEWGMRATTVVTPPPGPTCATAREFDKDIQYEFTVPPGEEQWWTTPVINLAQRCYRTYPPTSSDPSFTVGFYVGTSCSNQGLAYTAQANFVAHQDGSIIIGGIDRLWVRWNNPTASPQTYRFLVHQGIC